MKDVYSEALKIVLARRRTQKEVSDLLIKKGYEAHEAHEAAQHYAEQGYIDDADYAIRYAHDAARIKGYGEHRIRMALREKGVDGQYIDDAIADTEFNIKEVIIKKFGQPRKVTYEQMNKMCAAIIRRGFSPGEVTRTVKEIYEIEES